MRRFGAGETLHRNDFWQHGKGPMPDIHFSDFLLEEDTKHGESIPEMTQDANTTAGATRDAASSRKPS